MLKNKQDLDKQLEAVKKEKELFDKKAEIRNVKKTMRRWNPPTTTKILIAFILLNCTAVEIYSMAVMWYWGNLDSLYSLITSVITESIAFAVYCAKAYNETKQEELIKLEREKLDCGSIDASEAMG